MLIAQEAANALWALATLGVADDALVRPIASAAVRLVPSLNAQGAANALWALATLRVADDALVRPIALTAVRLAPMLIAQGAANALWALATLGVADDALVRPIALAAVHLAPTLIAQDAANALWALATLGVADDALVRPIAMAVERLCAGPNIKTARQVLQADLVLGTGRRLSRALLDSCRATVAAQPERLTISQLQRDVAAALARLGYAPTLEVAVLGGLCSVDILLEPTLEAAGRPAISRRTAVEVDGPTHFASRRDGAGRRELVPLGSTRLRNRLLREVAGLAVVCVPYVEWDLRGRDAAARAAWLVQQLAAAQRG